ncbi:ATP-binding protein [Sporomusa acidovorans]|uniref:histidine kinase n=1 Tax=Sporomusa acidovorans (strain ATCC 49682 / DSM 3132 / Mol) TaxID=1123286 RepID=A0ABZ3JAN0_SPOA4|nr:ATP-binding protein [Sporomusa acidovorans]OZC21772.1 sporulation kinase A [Sporomusa acidovorans DSM 3132]SDD57296.1 Signal transduction histidine kinase [Sporomusa acidovorans]
MAQPVSQEQIVKSLIKLNNLLGFLPQDLSASLSAIQGEIKKLLNPDRLCVSIAEFGNIGEEVSVCPCKSGNRCNCPVRSMEFRKCQVVRDVLPVVVRDTDKEEGCPNCGIALEFHSYTCLPIVAGKKILGVLSSSSFEADFYDREALEILLVMANLMGVAIQRDYLIRHLEAEKQELRCANTEMHQMARDLANMLEELKTTQTQLIQSEKLAMAGRLTADLAHEINNPAGVIVSRAECMLLEKEGLSAEQQEDLEIIIKHAKKIGTIVRSMLSFARPALKGKTWVDLRQLLEEVISFVAKQLSKNNIRIKTEFAGNVKISANADQLQQVFLNLINNAKDVMPEGGTLTIRTGRYNAQWLKVEIQDTGCGIPENLQDQIFEPFFTTKERGRGTGLGLSISYSIIQQHGGQIQVFSEKGQGSTFAVLLPSKSKL